ncbi:MULTISPECIES: phage gp6-like head-tail connector protein [unclassified Streptomyces]|uniref:phage gp6-like head-tail connector protein n=1 Tax=unclassified Streptomyces TaxID=2593676 RepID=UPI0012FEE533|nr:MULTISPECIES: phage gp6-like head-tail connector protein [unclassified Streptomyces]
MAFVTTEEVASRLGWPLTPEEEVRVQAFIEDCSVLIEDYCGKDFERRTDQSFELVADVGCWLSIPRRYLPYLTVDSVSYADGVPLTGWQYTGQGLYIYPGWSAGHVVTITGSWGYTNLPGVLRVATAAEVIRWMAQTPGLAMERTGEREVEFATASSPQSLSQAAKDALKRYRPSAGTITLRREGR